MNSRHPLYPLYLAFGITVIVVFNAVVGLMVGMVFLQNPWLALGFTLLWICYTLVLGHKPR